MTNTKNLEKISLSRVASLVAYPEINQEAKISLYGKGKDRKVILENQNKVYSKKGNYYHRINTKEFFKEMREVKHKELR